MVLRPPAVLMLSLADQVASLALFAARSWLGGGLMDPFRLGLALGPVGVYFLALGVLNLSRRPWVTTGGRDLTALLLALSGLMIVGPLELLLPASLKGQIGLLLPEGLKDQVGLYAWMVWLGLFFLLTSMTVAMLAPRLVIYNIAVEELFPVLSEVALSLDNQAHWAGETLLMPDLGVQLRIDRFTVMRNVSLVAVGDRQSPRGWRTLGSALAERLARTEVPMNPWGVSLTAFGLLMLGLLTAKWVHDPQHVTRSFQEMFLR